MKITFIFFVIVVVAFIGCTKKERQGENEYVQLSYKQTQCSDPWANGSTDSLTLVNAANYLNGAGLYIADMHIKQESPSDVCQGCSCKTGKVIYVSTLNNSTLKEKYAQLGFK